MPCSWLVWHVTDRAVQLVLVDTNSPEAKLPLHVALMTVPEFELANTSPWSSLPEHVTFEIHASADPAEMPMPWNPLSEAVTVATSADDDPRM